MVCDAASTSYTAEWRGIDAAQFIRPRDQRLQDGTKRKRSVVYKTGDKRSCTNPADFSGIEWKGQPGDKERETT